VSCDIKWRIIRNATSWKVAGSSPDEVIEFFNWPNSSSHTRALWLTQSLREMSTRNLPGGKGWAACKAENLTPICELIVYKMWEPQRLTTIWASTVCYRDSFPLFSNHFSLNHFLQDLQEKENINTYLGNENYSHGSYAALYKTKLFH
jgi:hypothetical protein